MAKAPNMTTQASRRQFLKGDFRQQQMPVRPPWARSEPEFTSLCDRCGDCVAVCPEQILSSGSGGYPEVDFSAGSCTFCSDCVRACRPAALYVVPGAKPWIPNLSIRESCLALNGVDCRICGEQCESRAIRFIHVLRSVARPHVSGDQCTGCGACVGPCPTGAITLSVNHRQGNQQQ